MRTSVADRWHRRLDRLMLAGLRQTLVDACQVLAGERLTDAFGHLSARTPDGNVLLTPRVGPGLIRDAGDLLLLSADGELLDGDPSLVPGETAIHLGVLRHRPDVMGVCRFHGAACMAWSSLARPLLPSIGIALVFGAEVPVHDVALTITDAAGADAMAGTLGAGSAVLLRGFGAVTAGPSIEVAAVRATFLERAAAASLAAHAVGEPRVYPAAAAEAFLAREAVLAEQMARAWTYLSDRHGR
jgi:ribulose-5-phosphate 4-epimerase/fuculose-1-phosphate aldolase